MIVLMQIVWQTLTRKQRQQFMSALDHSPSAFTKHRIAEDSIAARAISWPSVSVKPKAWDALHASGATNK